MPEYTSRDRMLAAMAREEPDLVPTGELGVDYPVTEWVLGRPTYYRAKRREREAMWANRRAEVVEGQKCDLVDLVRVLRWDFVPAFLTYRSDEALSPKRFIDENHWEDAFGRTWAYSEVTEDILCVDAPRLDESALAILEEPFVPHPSELELVRYLVETLGDTHFIAGRTAIELRDVMPVMGRGAVDGTFPETHGGLLMDMVDFSMRLLDEPDFVARLLSAATDRAIRVALTLIEAGADAIIMDTDYCTQKGPWISPRHFESIVMPLLRREVEAVHGAGAYLIKHTDGNLWPIMDQLVDAGIDGLHGIQPSAGMDLATLKARYGDRLTLFGAVEGPHLIEGTPEEIRDLVRRQIHDVAPGGGYVLTSSNSIQMGVPPQNYLAMLEARDEFGCYPIQ